MSVSTAPTVVAYREQIERVMPSWRLSPKARDVLVCAASYIYGSLPLVYWLGRRRSVDLKYSGSGNVGATNLLAAGGRSLSVVGWLFDASKGLVPVVVARRLGCPEDVAEVAGACGVAGQCWPVFLGMSGGRGISAFIGASFAITDRSTWALSLLPFIGGGLWRVGMGRLLKRSASERRQRPARSKSVPFGCFVGVTLFPLLHATRRRLRDPGAPFTLVPGLLTVVILLRRLTAPLPDDVILGPEMRPSALWYRLLYDRNTSE